MRRRLFIVACAALTAASACRVAAAHTAADAVALVDRAASYLQTHARADALAAFSDPHGSFRDGDLYVYVLDASDDRLVMLAHGANPGLIGMPQREMVDAEGKPFNLETVAITRNEGAGWVDYKWPNPVTRKIAPKRSYVHGVGDLIIGAGLYQ